MSGFKPEMTSLPYHPKPPRPFAERCLSALEDLADGLANRRILKAPGFIGELRQPTDLQLAAVGDDDLIYIGVHDEVCVMGDHDDLSALTC